MKNELEMRIGTLAKQSDVTVETVKFYEKVGLVPQPKKPASGFRSYPKEYVLRILFIKRAQELGFTLREVKELLKLNIDKKSACHQGLKRARDKIIEIDSKIKDLQKMKRSLMQIRDCCERDAITECAIEECFSPKTQKGGCV
jgi:DNA-binding transcriptional MerR regulator